MCVCYLSALLQVGRCVVGTAWCVCVRQQAGGAQRAEPGRRKTPRWHRKLAQVSPGTHTAAHTHRAGKGVRLTETTAAATHTHMHRLASHTTAMTS